MATFNNLICPVSSERVDENQVRITAFIVVLLTAAFLFTEKVVFPSILVLDFYIRAFSRLKRSPVSFISYRLVRLLGTQPAWINKGPKVFAARIGFMFSLLMLLASLLGLPLMATISGSILVLFAFLECGVNFCAGCWVYTYVVLPLVRKNH